MSAITATAPRRIVAALVAAGVGATLYVAPPLSSPAAAATPTAPSTTTSTTTTTTSTTTTEPSGPVLNAKTAHRWARVMLRWLNNERAAHHRQPLKMNRKLIASAHTHNLAMAAADEMSHQLPREANFAVRISRAGYKWQAAGENIGYNSDQTLHGLRVVELEMYHEKAPDNGHRLNILSRNYRNVGIDVYFDSAHNTMWFTQDFGHLATW